VPSQSDTQTTTTRNRKLVIHLVFFRGTGREQDSFSLFTGVLKRLVEARTGLY
jgi:hypothetical protein